MNQDRRQKDRYNLSERLRVFGQSSGQPIGELVNLSVSGAMLVTDGPVGVGTVLPCRVALTHTIMNRREALFDAECRWSRKNITAGRWESGFRLNVTGIDAELISYVILSFKLRDWGDIDIRDAKTVDMANRRASTRFEFDRILPVFERDSYRRIGRIADLSADGMRLITRRPFPKGGILNCKIKLFEKIFQQEYLVLDARCLWCRPGTDPAEYESGYIFANLSTADSAVISRLMIQYGRAQSTSQRIKVIR